MCSAAAVFSDTDSENGWPMWQSSREQSSIIPTSLPKVPIHQWQVLSEQAKNEHFVYASAYDVQDSPASTSWTCDTAGDNDAVNVNCPSDSLTPSHADMSTPTHEPAQDSARTPSALIETTQCECGRKLCSKVARSSSATCNCEDELHWSIFCHNRDGHQDRILQRKGSRKKNHRGSSVTPSHADVSIPMHEPAQDSGMSTSEQIGTKQCECGRKLCSKVARSSFATCQCDDELHWSTFCHNRDGHQDRILHRRGSRKKNHRNIFRQQTGNAQLIGAAGDENAGPGIEG